MTHLKIFPLCFCWFATPHGSCHAGNPRGTWPFTAPEAAWPCGQPWDLAKADVTWRHLQVEAPGVFWGFFLCIKKCDVFKTMSVYLLIFTHKKQTHLFQKTDRRLRVLHGDAEMILEKHRSCCRCFLGTKIILPELWETNAFRSSPWRACWLRCFVALTSGGPLSLWRRTWFSGAGIPRKLGL